MSDAGHQTSGIGLTPARRRTLMRQAHGLKPALAVGREGITPGILQQLRQCLETCELLKVRLHYQDRDEADEAARTLAREVPCALVGRIGRVAVLFRGCPDETTGR